MKDVELASTDGGLAYIVKEVIGSLPGRLLLADVAFAIFVCTLSVHSGTVRVVFAMARDGRLPFSASFARVSQSTHTPVLPAILVGLGAILILVINVQFPKIVELVTAVAILWANLAYLLVVAAMLRRRLRGWPDADMREGRRAFSLGRFGLSVNVLALLWSVFMVVNVGWPRTLIYGEANRFAALSYTILLLVVGASYFWLLARMREPCRQRQR